MKQNLSLNLWYALCLFCTSMHEALMTVAQLFGHVFALESQPFNSFTEDACFIWVVEILDTALLLRNSP